MKRHYFSFLFVFIIACTLTGCAQNIVALSYPSLPQSISTQQQNISVCIVDFENKRGKSAIGVMQDGRELLPRTPVERWLASSIAEELKQKGFSISMAETLSEAIQAKPDYILFGEAEEVWICESSFARYTGTVRSSVSLLHGNGEHITKNSYSSVFSKTALPMSGIPKKLLDDALFEMFQPAVKLLIPLLR